MNLPRYILIGLAVYAVIGIYTFGYAAAESTKWGIEQECGSGGKSRDCIGHLPVANGLFAAFVWPLYWSWEAQS